LSSFADVVIVHECVGAFLGRVAAEVFTIARITLPVVGIGQSPCGRGAYSGERAFVSARFVARTRRRLADGVAHIRFDAVLGRIATDVFTESGIATPVVGVEDGYHAAVGAVCSEHTFLHTGFDGGARGRRAVVIGVAVRVNAFLGGIATEILTHAVVAGPVVSIEERRRHSAIGDTRARLAA